MRGSCEAPWCCWLDPRRHGWIDPSINRITETRIHRYRYQDTGAPVQVGMEVELEHTFGPEAVATFAALSGDDNPIHLDPLYATKQVRKKGDSIHQHHPDTRSWSWSSSVCLSVCRGVLQVHDAVSMAKPKPLLACTAQGIFKGAIVHGLLVGSLFGTIFGVTFPGCVYLQQSFKVWS